MTLSRPDTLRSAWAKRPEFTPLGLSLVTAIFVFAVHNATFWRIGPDVFAGHMLSFAGLIAAVFCLALAVQSVFCFPYVVKPFLAFVLILGAVTSYYMDQLGVIIDRDMIQNVMVTTVTVLHQIGSHGPTYYLRYPEAFERFKPACRTAEFKECTAAEITNAYDNTIAYTDAMLARTIDLLDQKSNLNTALIYVSDHGESLGESGLYLHRSPYFMAPACHSTVPMVLWMSERFKAQFNLDDACLSQHADVVLSHDNLFHSLLGMLDISTRERDPALDIFAPCHTSQRVAQK